MRKLLFFITSMFITGSLLAGGLVTNNNQSAMFTRLQNRNASTSIDAVYYNPAGLTKLQDGFHFSLNNQTISQTQTIVNNYMFLSGTPKEYVGNVSAPIFPSVYAAYKKGKFVISGGFNPIGGGGGAKYETGLPSFEMSIADMVPGLKTQLAPLDAAFTQMTGTNPGFSNITGYTSDIFFEGTSVYFGYQANVSYELSDLISVAVGGRLVSAKNTYKGSIQNVNILAPAAYGGAQTPGQYFRTIAGIPGMPPSTAAVLNGTATYLDKVTDVQADVEMTGTGFAPILSVNLTPSEKLNIAVRYEFKTILDLKTNVSDGKDANGMFIQDSVAIADMPASLSIGANFKPFDKLTLSGTLNYYWDKDIDYDGQEAVNVSMIDNNFVEFGLGAEYAMSDKLRISAGWSHTNTGVNSAYQSDMSFSANTNSFGAGFGYRISDMIDLNIGGQYTFYDEAFKDFNHYLGGIVPMAVHETYNKKTWLIGVGLDFSFGTK